MEKIKAVGYCRVSTEEQAREEISLDNQQDKVRAYATVKDLDLVDIVIDAGISAKDDYGLEVAAQPVIYDSLGI